MSHVASISQLRSRYLRLRWTEVMIFALSAAMGAGAIGLVLLLPYKFVAVIALLAALPVAFWRYRVSKLSKVDNLRISLYLNRFYPELKESSDLLIKDDESLSSLERIQLNRIDNDIKKLLPGVQLPHAIPQAFVALVAGGVLLAIALYMMLYIERSLAELRDNEPFTRDEVITPPDPSIREALINIDPPYYTRLAKTSTDRLTFSTVEGSVVTWNISFHQPVSDARIVMTSGDSIVQKTSSQQIEFKYTVTTSVLYRIRWTANGESHSSDYHRIDVKPDQVPAVAVKELPQFTRLKWGEKNVVEVTSGIQDDYGLSAAYVIATVSKGSGESVKFREEKIPFASPKTIGGTNVTGKLTLDFKKLGMDPGDEVYFYVEAFDNKQPVAQRNRTDTYFIALQDTAQQELVMSEGLGVDLMPDYFRSQRQLIIDTEKLIAEQKKISKHQFNSTSNELGYDQKVLRLRYGQFLGEEFETSIGASNVQEVEGGEEEEEDGDIMKKYGHQHDTKNEHNLVPDKKSQPTEQHHDHDGDDDKEKNDPMAAYRHDHDSEEAATFFTQSIKTKLRAALTLMWDSELQLRMYHPKESLPYQYEILKLLKEIAQDSRIYVHRMGFDPPPIKEDKRLTGALDEVNPGRIENKAVNDLKYPAIRKALTDISEALMSDPIRLTDQQRSNLHAAGDELAGLALTSPGSYLEQLSDLKLIAEENASASEVRGMLEEIQKAFWAVLPNEAPSPTQQGSGAHPLDVKFLNEIKAKAND